MKDIRTAARPRTPKSLAVAIAAALCLQPTSGATLGLGTLSARSNLGEPLAARIQVHLGADDERQPVAFEVTASPDAATGSPLPGVVETLGPDGRFLSLETEYPVNEPIIMFSLTARSSSATVTREYTLLLDPPQHISARANRSSGEARKPGKPRAQAKRRGARVPAIAVAGNGSPRGGTGKDQVRVATGDTLWEIGSRLAAGSGVAGSQLAWALFEANPSAFMNERPESLLAGALLRIPASAFTSGISSASARVWLRGGNAPGQDQMFASNGGGSSELPAEPANSPKSNQDSGKRLAASSATLAKLSSPAGDEPPRSHTTLDQSNTLAVAPQHVGTAATPASNPTVHEPIKSASSPSNPSAKNETGRPLRLQRTLLTDIPVSVEQRIRLTDLSTSIQRLEEKITARDLQIANLQMLVETRLGELAQARAAAAITPMPTNTTQTHTASHNDERPGPQLIAGISATGFLILFGIAAVPFMVSRLVSKLRKL